MLTPIARFARLTERLHSLQVEHRCMIRCTVADYVTKYLMKQNEIYKKQKIEEDRLKKKK